MFMGLYLKLFPLYPLKHFKIIYSYIACSLCVAKLLALLFTFHRLNITLLPNIIPIVEMSNRRWDVD